MFPGQLQAGNEGDLAQVQTISGLCSHFGPQGVLGIGVSSGTNERRSTNEAGTSSESPLVALLVRTRKSQLSLFAVAAENAANAQVAAVISRPV